MKKVLLFSTIVFLSACDMKEEGNKPQNKDSTIIVVPGKDSVKVTTQTDTNSPPAAAVARLKWDTAELKKNCKKLEEEKVRLVNDTARLGLANRQLISENKNLAALKSKVSTKSQGDDCASVRKENASLKKTNQTLTIRNTALEGENIKLTQQLNPQKQADTKAKTVVRDSKKRGTTKKNLKEEYKEIFNSVNGGKN